ncbi:MAG: hypothetical protein KC547_17955 [Anaerolineae bacterium]|nr:hypothetical protein [Anaerolineae bacterium]
MSYCYNTGMHSNAFRKIESYHVFNHILARHPFRWFERRWLQVLTAFSLGFGLLYVQAEFAPIHPTAFIAAGLVSHLVGTAWDIYTTASTMRLKARFDQLGLEFPIYEANPLLPAHPTLADQLVSVSGLIGVAALPVIYYFPGIGVGSGVARLLAGIYNLRQKNRLLLTLDTLDNEPSHC